MSIDRDVDVYTEGFSRIYENRNDLIGLIRREEGAKMTCLDLGCGRGTLTKELSDRGFVVAGMDASEEVLDAAREKYPYIAFVQGDPVSFELAEQIDVVVSSGVFDRIDADEHREMLEHVYDALKPGGQFVLELGGKGNTQLIQSALTEIFHMYGIPYRMPFYFPGLGEYTSLLDSVGFTTTYARLFDHPLALRGEDGLAGWIRTVMRRSFEGIRKSTAEQIIRDTVEALRDSLYYEGTWYVDYVRLRCKALRDPST